MSAKRLLLITALAALAIASSLWLSARRSAPPSSSGARVLPGLAIRLDAVSGIEIEGAGPKPLVTLARKDGHWQVVESGGYPADEPRVRRLLVALGDLEVLETKTADPERYAALGLEDLATATAKSLRLTLAGAAGTPKLVVGKAAGTHGSYVRVEGAGPALEARPLLEVPRAPRDWLARALLDITSARIQSAEITRSDGPAWRTERDSPTAAHFTVPGLPRGRELASAGAADAIGSALANLELDDVRAAANSADPHAQRALLRSFDGLVLSFEGRGSGDERWVRLSASFDPHLAARFAVKEPAPAAAPSPGAAPAAAATTPAATTAAPADGGAEAARINALTHGWEYRLPRYRFDALFRPRDELLRH